MPPDGKPQPEDRAKPFADNGVSKDMEAAAVYPSMNRDVDRDGQLMLRVREGDTQSFTLLLERHRGPVIHFLFRMVQNQAIAEELAQEVFLRVYKSRETYEPTAKFTTWLYRIATHLALNVIRDGKHERGQDRLDSSGAVRSQTQQDEAGDSASARQQVADSGLSAEAAMVRNARLEEVREAISALPEKQRAAVMMHKYDNLGYAQIAGALGCSESALKSLLFRAYETLRARLLHLAQ